MEPSTVKFLIGHGPDSTVMESTYQHLSGEDYSKKAEIKAGIRSDEDQESSLSPAHCDICKEPLGPNAKACPSCGTVYTPDARSAQEQIQGDADDKKDQADDIDLLKAVDKIQRIQEENPELLEELDL